MASLVRAIDTTDKPAPRPVRRRVDRPRRGWFVALAAFAAAWIALAQAPARADGHHHHHHRRHGDATDPADAASDEAEVSADADGAVGVGASDARTGAAALTPGAPLTPGSGTNGVLPAVVAGDAGASSVAPGGALVAHDGGAGGDGGGRLTASDPTHAGPDAHASATAPTTTTTPPQAHARPLPSAGRVARVVIGLFLLLALAIVAGHPAVQRFERRAGLAMFVATGMPFLAIGVVAHLPSIGILSDDILRDLGPFLEFGLGWVGFRVGVEFDVREFDRMPRGIARMLTMESAGAFVAAGLGSVAALGMLGGRTYSSEFVRDGLVLGACAAVSAPTGARALEAAGILDRDSARVIRRIAVLDDAVPLAVLALVTAVFRPVAAGRWHLPPLGWVFLQVGMGAALGALTLAVVRAAENANEEIAFTFGAVAFASGMAGYLGFSPLVVGCVAGVIVANVASGGQQAAGSFGQKLRELERPIYLVFFAIAGAMWDVRDWRGWAVVPLYVLARLLGKLGGARAAYRAEKVDAVRRAEREREEASRAATVLARPEQVYTDPHGSMPPAPPPVSSWRPIAALPDGRTIGIALVPTSAVSIAVIVSARQSYPDSIAPFLETVVIVGAIVAELVFQFSVPVVRRTSFSPEDTTGPFRSLSGEELEVPRAVAPVEAPPPLSPRDPAAAAATVAALVTGPKKTRQPAAASAVAAPIAAAVETGARDAGDDANDLAIDVEFNEGPTAVAPAPAGADELFRGAAASESAAPPDAPSSSHVRSKDPGGSSRSGSGTTGEGGGAR